MRKVIVGVMGPGDSATSLERDLAYTLGQLIAQQGWILLTGGRNTGVMEAANQGAKAHQGLTVGILPTQERQSVSAAVDIAIFTDMGSARNNINVLSSDVVIACGMGMGTASEVALALKANKKVILLHSTEASQLFFQSLAKQAVLIAQSPQAAIKIVAEILEKA